jgi:hypothetical protein
MMSQHQSTQWWIISAGEDSVREKVWNEFRNSNTVGFYWNETGDLSKLTEEQIKEKFKEIGIKEKGKPRFWDPARAILMVKKNDILFVKLGKRGFYGIAKATDTYQYNTNQSYHHTIPVQWITTQPYKTPDGYPLKLQLNYTMTIIPDKNQEPEIVKYYENAINGNHDNLEYFLLRHNVDGTWKDDLGKKYHFGKTVPNQKKLRETGPGTKTIWFTKQSGEFYFWGYGSVKEIEIIQENLEWNLVYDNFKYFVRNYDTSIPARGKFLKKANKSNKEEIENLPKYNMQTSMFPITKKIYDQILSQDLSHNNKESTY